MSLLPDYEDEFGPGGQRYLRSDRITQKLVLDEAATSMSLVVPKYRTHLRIHFVGRGDANEIYALYRMRFATGINESDFDDGPNYDSIQLIAAATEDDLPAFEPPGVRGRLPESSGSLEDVVGVFGDFAQTSAFLGSVPGATTETRFATTISIDVPNYSGATFYKGCHSLLSSRIDDSHYVAAWSHIWKEIGPIRAVKLLVDSGNFVAGSMLMVEVS